MGEQFNLYFNILGILFLCAFPYTTQAGYQIGVGRGDCTGPAAEINFMGYAKLGQFGCGIHLRQFARAFIFDDGNQRAAYVTVDACMMHHSIRKEVLNRLSSMYNSTYTVNNLILSGTHTHGAPGGYLMDVLLDISVLGFVRDTFDALVDGIVNAIVKAHNNMVDAKIFMTSGELLDSNINRSPASYLYNPEDERAQYPYDVDKDMVQLKFVRTSDNKPIGAVNWFAVHPTSMNNTNCLVTSDNVGYASIQFEQSMNDGALPGQGDFVGAFASTNLGDVSPNTKGPHCIDTGEACDVTTSTCDGKNELCIASGPGNDMFESTEIIAGNLFKKAQDLINDEKATEVTGPVKYIHQFVEMPKETATITLENGTTQDVRGCLSAMGYSFAAGTTDGPGEFDFKQGTTTTNPFWNAVRDFIFPPTPDDVDCHFPKPILFATGRIAFPYEWQPQIVTTQIVMIGNAVLNAVPGEFTTMSGRRMRNAVRDEIISNGGSNDTRVIITGLSNMYTNYIATPEEYQLQRYEGASTIFGPHTLTIYLKLYRQLAASLMKGEDLDAGPDPPAFPANPFTLVPPVLFDTAGWAHDFGDCILQPAQNVKIGDIVKAKFLSGHPRNNVMHGKTFLTVEKLDDNKWKVVKTDANWETKFIWRRVNFIKGGSEAEIQWQVKENVEPGTYRIGHFGNYKYILGGIFPYQGYSRNFTVAAN